MLMDRTVRVSACVALLVSGALAGCAAPHVALSAPAPDAPLQERVSAYERLSPVHATHDPFSRSFRPISHESIRLSGGEEVHYAEDLLPVVPERSRTANSARKSAELRRSGAWIGNAGLVVGLAGAALTFGAILPFAGGDREAPPVARTLGGVGVLAMVGGIVTMLVGKGKVNKADDEQMWASATYDADLRARLNLCRKDDMLVDCSVVRGLPPHRP